MPSFNPKIENLAWIRSRRHDMAQLAELCEKLFNDKTALIAENELLKAEVRDAGEAIESLQKSLEESQQEIVFLQERVLEIATGVDADAPFDAAVTAPMAINSSTVSNLQESHAAPTATENAASEGVVADDNLEFHGFYAEEVDNPEIMESEVISAVEGAETTKFASKVIKQETVDNEASTPNGGQYGDPLNPFNSPSENGSVSQSVVSASPRTKRLAAARASDVWRSEIKRPKSEKVKPVAATATAVVVTADPLNAAEDESNAANSDLLRHIKRMREKHGVVPPVWQTLVPHATYRQAVAFIFEQCASFTAAATRFAVRRVTLRFHCSRVMKKLADVGYTDWDVAAYERDLAASVRIRKPTRKQMESAARREKPSRKGVIPVAKDSLSAMKRKLKQEQESSATKIACLRSSNTPKAQAKQRQNELLRLKRDPYSGVNVTQSSVELELRPYVPEWVLEELGSEELLAAGYPPPLWRTDVYAEAYKLPVKAIFEYGISTYAASEFYGVKRSTLQFHCVRIKNELLRLGYEGSNWDGYRFNLLFPIDDEATEEDSPCSSGTSSTKANNVKEEAVDAENNDHNYFSRLAGVNQ